MKTIRVLSDPIKEFQGDTIYKTETSLTLLNKGSIVFEIKGVNNWSMFQIIGDIDKTQEQIMNEAIESIILSILK